MPTQNLSMISQGIGIRAWKYEDLPMPDWIQDLAGSVQPNGTFSLETDNGPVRVHPRDVVIERGGNLWVRHGNEASTLMKSLQESKDATITNIGPGKAHQFGTSERLKRKAKAGRIDDQHNYPPPVGSRPTIEWIQLGRLSVDGAYQRSTDNDASRRLIAGIASKFDWRLCAPLVVSRRGDHELVIIDGQHRWMAARRRTDIDQLPCCIFRYESTQEEARMFIVANRARKPINRLDDFYAAVAAGDEDALEIQQLVTGAGLRVARNTSATGWRPGEVVFTSSIANAVRRFGPATTGAALAHMAAAFSDQRLLHGAAILGALLVILSKAGADFDTDRLSRALRTRTLEQWAQVTAGLVGGDERITALRKTIMDLYGN